MKKLAFKFVLITIFIVIMFSMIFFSRPPVVLACTTKLSMINQPKDDVSAIFHMSFFLNNNELQARIEGSATLPNGTSSSISRIIVFETKNSSFYYTLKTKRIIISTADNTTNSIMHDILPSFYSTEGEVAHIKIYIQENGGAVFSTGSLPSFYCL